MSEANQLNTKQMKTKVNLSTYLTQALTIAMIVLISLAMLTSCGSYGTHNGVHYSKCHPRK